MHTTGTILENCANNKHIYGSVDVSDPQKAHAFQHSVTVLFPRLVPTFRATVRQARYIVFGSPATKNCQLTGASSHGKSWQRSAFLLRFCCDCKTHLCSLTAKPGLWLLKCPLFISSQLVFTDDEPSRTASADRCHVRFLTSMLSSSLDLCATE